MASAAAPSTPLLFAAPASPADAVMQPASTPASTLDDIEQHLLTLLHSASQLLTALSAVTASQAELAAQHAHTFLSTLQQLRTALAAATAASSQLSGLGAGERQHRRSAYLDALMFQLECDMSAHVSEQLDGIEQFAQQAGDRARQRLAEAGLS